MPRIGTRSLLLAIDGTDYTDEVSRAVITSAALGGPGSWRNPTGWSAARTYALGLTLAQDAGPDSLWSLANAAPATEATYYFAPYGNAEATSALPHYTGTLWVQPPDGDLLGGSADPSRSSVLTVDAAWPIDGDPIRVETGTYPADLPEGW